MDALGIARADLVGWSMGGNELTGMANRYPERVRSLIYFDGAYDTSDPDFAALLTAVPAEMFATPAQALVSFDAYRDFMGAEHYSQVSDMSRLDSYLRATMTIHPDGHLEPRMSKELIAELYATLGADRPRDYMRIRCPVLAFFPESQVNTDVPALRELENKYMSPFREKSMAQLRREMPQVEIIVVPGTHQCFFMTSRERVAREMLRFLAESAR
jgi:pimeloyl-ACP methyl ester carboxylesterase